jgi:hypothetical protein
VRHSRAYAAAASCHSARLAGELPRKHPPQRTTKTCLTNKRPRTEPKDPLRARSNSTEGASCAPRNATPEGGKRASAAPCAKTVEMPNQCAIRRHHVPMPRSTIDKGQRESAAAMNLWS